MGGGFISTVKLYGNKIDFDEADNSVNKMNLLKIENVETVP